MTVVALNKSTFTQVNAVAKRIQFFGGRVFLANSASPTANDWFVLKEGESINVTAIKYAMSLDSALAYAVVQDL